MMSFIVVAGFLGYLMSHVVYTGKGARKEKSKAIQRFLASDMGTYFLSLMICDITPTLAAVMNIRWAVDLSIHHDPMCNIQGAFNQFGVTGSAVFNLFLAIQTFLLLVLRVTPPKWLNWLALSAGWLFPVLMTVLGPALNTSSFSFYGPTSAGCWLTFGSSNYVAWFWAVSCISLGVLFIMMVLYFGLFLSLSGALDRLANRTTSVPTGSSNSGNRHGTSTPIGAAERRGREVRKIARKMLWFPAFYAVASLPIVISVLIAANGKVLPHLYYIVADCLFSALGIADVFIFLATRRHLLLSRSASSATPSGGPGVMMTIVSFTSGSAPQPWDSLSSPPPPLPSGNRFGPSPLGLGTWDEQGDIISPAEKGRKDGGIWDGPTGPTKGAAAPTSLSPPHSRAPSRTGDGSNRRGSRLERVARSQGEEDSRGLVILGDLERGRETEEEEEEEGRPPVGTHPWDPNRPNAWEMMDSDTKTRIIHGKAF
ncbi:hypothetical protein BDY24DRAFT_394174 [Mrakia frigida]|uniref:uncharacterized protein n=1 Tax=Mrakia frigida TaxID=29902 RepID=UPI003FCC0976